MTAGAQGKDYTDRTYFILRLKSICLTELKDLKQKAGLIVVLTYIK